jgi:phosphoribosyl-dephospho-CoA transferase
MPRVHDFVCMSDGRWAVVRRRRSPAGIAIGIRGATRAERRALVVDENAIVALVTPEEAARRPAPRLHPVFDALRRTQSLAESLGLTVGATGGCGYELVTGEPSLHAESDLDVIVRADFDDERLHRLAGALRGGEPRVDVEVLRDDGCGAALEEIVQGGPFLVKTPDGPRLAPFVE